MSSFVDHLRRAAHAMVDEMDAAQLSSLVGYGQQLMEGVKQAASQPGLATTAKKREPVKESMQQGAGNPTGKGRRPAKQWSPKHTARRNYLFRVLATLPCKVGEDDELLTQHASRQISMRLLWCAAIA